MICTLAKAFDFLSFYQFFPISGHFLLPYCYGILQIVMTHVNNVSASAGKWIWEWELELKLGS